MFNLKSSSSFNNLFVVYLLFGTQLISFIPSLLKVNPQIFLWVGNGITLVFAVVIILRNLKKIPKTKKIHFGLLIFIFLYSIRMLYDLYINNIYTYSFPNEYTYLLYFYGLVLLPCVGIFFIEEIDYQKILKKSYIVQIGRASCRERE